MKIIPEKKSLANLMTGVSYQIINALLGLVLPYLFITSFGSETNGLLSSITQLFVYVNLLEAGVGAASVQAMYRPLANGDRDGVNGILAATTRFYLRTGILYVLVVILLTMLYPVSVHTDLPNSTVSAVILLQGFSGAVNYLVSSKYTLLLKAEGKLYISNTLALSASILRNVGKIVAISMGYDVVAVQAIHFVISVSQSLVIVIYIKWKYMWVRPWGKANFQAIAQRNSALVHQLAWLVFNHIDVVLLTFVTGNLAVVSVYSLYLLVFEAIQNVLDIIGNGLQYKMGYNAQLSTEALRKYYRQYEAGFLALSFALIVVAYLFVRGFIRLYTSGVTDADYLAPGLAELFAVMKLLSIIRQMNRQAVEAAGQFKRTQKYSIAEMGINLGFSLLLVPFWGIYGVLVGSIAALLFSVVSYTRYTNLVILKTNCRIACSRLIIYLITAIVIAAMGDVLLAEEYGSYLELILTVIPTFLVVCAAFGGEVFIVFRCTICKNRLR